MSPRPGHGIPADAFRSEPIDPPSSLGVVAELRSAAQLARLGLHLPRLAWRRGRCGNEPVVVLPGIHASDTATLGLRHYLAWLGHDVRGWGLGRNRADAAVIDQLVDQLDRAVDEDGQPRNLVGWSLGGLMARAVALRRPDLVARVVTYGTPVVGGAAYTIFARRYSDGDTRRAARFLSDQPVPVPVTAIYSRSDHVVAWRACIDHHSPDVRHVEVRSTHVGMGLDPDVWTAIAQALAAREPSRPTVRGARTATS